MRETRDIKLIPRICEDFIRAFQFFFAHARILRGLSIQYVCVTLCLRGKTYCSKKYRKDFEISNIGYSDYTPVDVVTASIDVVAALPGAPTLTTNVAVLGSIGIEFYQQVGVNYYLFNAGNAMKVQEVF